MSRKSVEVSKELLTKCVADAESSQAFNTQQELWAKVVELYNITSPTETITTSVAYLRVKEWNISFATKSAKGRRKGSKLSDEQKAAMLNGRKNGGSRVRFNSKDKDECIKILRAKTPERFWPLVDKVANGSRAAASKLFCIECMGHQVTEVSKCTSMGCPHFLMRPYQKGSEDEGEVIGETEEEISSTEVAPELQEQEIAV